MWNDRSSGGGPPAKAFRSRERRLGALVNAVTVAVLFTTLVYSQEPRRVLLTRRQPLLAYLKADDRHVVIESALPRPQKLGPAAGETGAHHLTSAYDVVLVVHVQKVSGVPMKLMTTPPTASEYKLWYAPAPESEADVIGSTVTARIETVVKGGRGIEPGSAITFEEEHGTALIRGVTVEYRIPWLQPLVAGRRYLFFANFTEDGRLVRREAYEEKLPGFLLVRTYLDADTRPNDEFESMTLNEALFQVGNAVRR
jgi:hypothetical protein